MPSHAYGIKLEARHKVKKGTSSPPCNIPRLSIPEFCSRSATSHFTWLFTYLFCCCCLESFVVFERGSHYIVLDGTVLIEIPLTLPSQYQVQSCLSPCQAHATFFSIIINHSPSSHSSFLSFLAFHQASNGMKSGMT